MKSAIVTRTGALAIWVILIGLAGRSPAEAELGSKPLPIEYVESSKIAPSSQGVGFLTQTTQVAPPTTHSVVLADIYMAEHRQTIAGEPASVLAETAEVLESENSWTLQVESYCDDRGTEAYSLVVGEQRVRAVEQYLLNAGVPPSQVRTVSYGVQQPLCREASTACWEDNLRVQFSIRLLALKQAETGCLARLRLITPRHVTRSLHYARRQPFLQRIQQAESPVQP